MNLLKRIAAAVMVVCVLLSFAGCGDTTWIAEIDGETVPSGLYIYYLSEGYGAAVGELYQQNSDYAMHYLYYANYGYVDTSILDVALESGQTVREYIAAYALDMCRQAKVVDKLFDELGLTIPEEDQDLIDSQVRNAWNSNGEMLESKGVSQTSLEAAIVAKYKENAVFDKYYEIGGLNGTTEEEIEAYFSDNYARVKYMTFTFADNIDDAVDDERKDEQYNLAQSYLERAEAGESMDDLIAEYNKVQAAANGETADEAESEEEAEPEADDTAGETEEDSTDETAEADDTAEAEEETDEYANEIILSKDAQYPTEKFVNYVFTACEVGGYTVIQDDTCFYLVQRLDVLEREGLYDNYRDSILVELFDSDYTKLINDKLAEYEVVINQKSVDRYKVDDVFED